MLHVFYQRSQNKDGRLQELNLIREKAFLPFFTNIVEARLQYLCEFSKAAVPGRAPKTSQRLGPKLDVVVRGLDGDGSESIHLLSIWGLLFSTTWFRMLSKLQNAPLV